MRLSNSRLVMIVVVRTALSSVGTSFLRIGDVSIIIIIVIIVVVVVAAVLSSILNLRFFVMSAILVLIMRA